MTILRRLMAPTARLLLSAPEGGGGAADGGNQNSGNDGGGGGGGAAPQNWDFSDLPEGLRGKDNADTYGKVKGEYFNLRNKAAAFAPPRDAKEYKFEPGEKIKPYFAKADDPLMGLARETAHKLGMPDAHFGPFINGLFEAAIEKGMLPPAFDPAAEVEAIGQMVAPGKTGAELKTAVQAALTEAEAFAPALADSLKLSDGGKKLLVSLANERGGVELLRALKGAGKEFGLQLGGQQQPQGYSWADYDRDVKDERYQAFGAKFDKTFREGVDAKMRALPPRGS
jgi:hypothetical protein